MIGALGCPNARSFELLLNAFDAPVLAVSCVVCVRSCSGNYRTQPPRRALGERRHAVTERARKVPSDYAAHARRLDEEHFDISAGAVRMGTVPQGPVLTRLMTYPDTVGLVFGAYGEASDSVHRLLDEAVASAARDWAAIGARSEAEARSFLSTRYHRLWGITAARAAARLRLSRMRYIGLSREEVERLRVCVRVLPTPPRVL